MGDSEPQILLFIDTINVLNGNVLLTGGADIPIV